MRAPRTALVTLLLSLLFGVVPVPALATSYVWINSAGGEWMQTGNWNYPGYPHYLWDFAIFNQDAQYEVDASNPSLTGVGGVLVTSGNVALRTHDGFTGVLAVGTVGPPARLELEGAVDGAGSHNVGATGTLVLQPGSRLLSRTTEAAGFDVASGGLLCGDQASLDGHLLRNLGTVSPGLSPGAPGLLILGQESPADYEQRETGLLEIDVTGPDPGTGYDQLRVMTASGPVRLDGSLAVAFAPGYVPTPGTRFDLVTAPEVVGTFSTVLLPEAPAGLELHLVYEPDRVSLQVEGTFVPAAATAYVLDVQPGSCPNPLGVNKRGVIPVALLGDSGLDVQDVDPGSLLLMGVAAARTTYADVGSPPDENDGTCTCGGLADGIEDILLKFPAPEVLDRIPGTEGTQELRLTGTLLDGTPFEATDCVDLMGGGSEVSRKHRIAPGSSPGKPIQTVSYALPVSGPVRLSVISVTGRLVTELVVAEESAGTHLVDWNASGQANGVYFYRLQSPAGVTTAKFLLAR
jgi:hypothetical protein